MIRGGYSRSSDNGRDTAGVVKKRRIRRNSDKGGMRQSCDKGKESAGIVIRGWVL